MGGSARLGPRTTAEIRWRLRPHAGGTTVTLAAGLRETGPWDRLLLALGGMAWLRRRFAGTLRALDDELSA